MKISSWSKWTTLSCWLPSLFSVSPLFFVSNFPFPVLNIFDTDTYTNTHVCVCVCFCNTPFRSPMYSCFWSSGFDCVGLYVCLSDVSTCVVLYWSVFRRIFDSQLWVERSHLKLEIRVETPGGTRSSRRQQRGMSICRDVNCTRRDSHIRKNNLCVYVCVHRHLLTIRKSEKQIFWKINYYTIVKWNYCFTRILYNLLISVVSFSSSPFSVYKITEL